jgi:hypothetical protein
VTSQFHIRFFHLSSAFLQVVRLIVFVTQFTAVLHAVSRVSCHNFLDLRLCFNSRSEPDRSLFKSKTVTLLVDSLYTPRLQRL